MLIREAEAKVTGVVSGVQSRIEDDLGSPVEETDEFARWRSSRYWIYTCEVTLFFANSRVRFKAETSDLLRYLIYISTVLVTGAVLANSFVFPALALSLCLVLAIVPPGVQISGLEDVTTNPRVQISPLLSIAVSAFLISAWRFFTYYTSEAISSSFLLLFSLPLLYWVYQLGGVPGITPGTGDKTVLSIPITAIAAFLISTFLFLVVSVMVSLLSSGNRSLAVYGFIALSLLETSVFLFITRNTLSNLRVQRLTPFKSSLGKFAAFLLYLILSAVLMFGIVLIVMFPIHSATGQLPFFPDSALDVVNPVYQQLDSVFEPVPLLPPRAYTTVFLSLPLLPVFIIAISWVDHILTSLYKPVLIYTGEVFDQSFNGVPDHVKVIKIPNSGIIAPVSFFFGLREFILIGDRIEDQLSDSELEAVAAHEAYHLLNRDWVVNTLASLFSALFGGRNTLLAFYDYPQIEIEADEYAARQISRKSLESAIRIMSRSPGDERFLLSYLLAPYHLFFGDSLLNASHLDVDARIQKLRENLEKD